MHSTSSHRHRRTPSFVLVRHGESLFNREGRFTGWAEVGLSELGRAQCRRAAEFLRESAFDAVMTSDLERARESARIILEGRCGPSFPEIITSSALRGRNDGVLVGLDKAETARSYGDELAPLWRRSFDLKLPGGESLADVANRVGEFYRRSMLPRLENGGNLLVVTHGNTIRALAIALGAYSRDSIIEVANGSIWTWSFTETRTRGPDVSFNG